MGSTSSEPVIHGHFLFTLVPWGLDTKEHIFFYSCVVYMQPGTNNTVSLYNFIRGRLLLNHRFIIKAKYFSWQWWWFITSYFLKGQCHAAGFFVKLRLLFPVDMPGNDFDFVPFFELFNNFDASPVSTITAKFALHLSLTLLLFSRALPVSWMSTTPAKETLPVSMMPVKPFFNGVNDTGQTLHMLLNMPRY